MNCQHIERRPIPKIHKMRTAVFLYQEQNPQPHHVHSRTIQLQRGLRPQSSHHFNILVEEVNSSSEQISQDDISFQEDKSCCCLDCGVKSKKQRILHERMTQFKPKMHIVKEIRLKLLNRLRVAVQIIICMIRKQVRLAKRKSLTKRRTLQRLKTKVNFETIIPVETPEFTKEFYIEPTPIQPVQMTIMDAKLKSRVSIQNYMNSKLNPDCTLLPKINEHHHKSQKSMITIKSCRQLGEHSKSPQRQNKLNTILQQSPTKIGKSPYLNQPGFKLFLESEHCSPLKRQLPSQRSFNITFKTCSQDIQSNRTVKKVTQTYLKSIIIKS